MQAPWPELQRFQSDRGTVRWTRAWTVREVRAAVAALFAAFDGRLPTFKDARIVLKPNLNNDLVALTGNSVDLRVLGAVLSELRDRGFHDLTIADGSNVGMERRNIDGFKRLRVDRMAKRFGARTVDLNHADGTRVALTGEAEPIIPTLLFENDFLISIPKVKTHAEAGFSCAMKNWVGIARGQDKRHMHYDLGRNIAAINEIVKPDFVVVDGLIGMEGNGPGDGDPVRLGVLAASDDTVVNDLVMSRMVDLPWEQIPYLRHALEAGRFDVALASEVRAKVPVLATMKRPPPRSKLSVWSENRRLLPLKKMVRPIVDRPEVAEAAYKMSIIQDVYDRRDDEVVAVRRNATDCGDCRKCEEFCPTFLSAEEIGRTQDPDKCIGCLYCWFVCPKEALDLEGPLHHLERQVARYKSVIEGL